MEKQNISKEGSYGLVEQFRVLAKRVALPSLILQKTRYEDMQGIQFDFRNPWYTTIPVSSVTDIELAINGKNIPKDKIQFVVRDMAIPFSYAQNLHELMWGMGEIAKIRIVDEESLNGLKIRNRVDLKFTIRTAFVGYHLPDNHIQYLFSEEMEVA